MPTGSGPLVTIPANGVELEGELVVPDGATGLVVFAHGSGSSRHSPRNSYVAEVLRDRGLGTLLFDLHTEAEDRSRENRFDVAFLTHRLDAATDWLEARDDTAALTKGYFGSSTPASSRRSPSSRPTGSPTTCRSGRRRAPYFPQRGNRVGPFWPAGPY